MWMSLRYRYSKISVLGIRLSKNRQRVRVEEEVDVLRHDGTTQKGRIKYDALGSAADADVVRQMTDISNAGQAKPEASKHISGNVPPLVKRPQNSDPKKTAGAKKPSGKKPAKAAKPAAKKPVARKK